MKINQDVFIALLEASDNVIQTVNTSPMSEFALAIDQLQQATRAARVAMRLENDHE